MNRKNSLMGDVAGREAERLNGRRNGVNTLKAQRCPLPPFATGLERAEEGKQKLFVRRVGSRRFKRESSKEILGHPDSKPIQLHQISRQFFSFNLGERCYRNSRDVRVKLRNVTMSRSDSRGFVLIQGRRKTSAIARVGIDLRRARRVPSSLGALSNRLIF